LGGEGQSSMERNDTIGSIGNDQAPLSL